MSIRAIARDLYKVKCAITEIEKKIEVAVSAELEELKIERTALEREHALIRKMLDGEKESSQFKKKFGGSGFSF